MAPRRRFDAYGLRFRHQQRRYSDLSGSVPLLAGSSPNHLVFTSSNSFVYVSLGTGGIAILSFNATSGVLTNNNQVLPPKQSVDAIRD